MSDSDRHWLYLPRWVEDNSDDPAMQEFLPQLKNHLLARVLGRSFDGDEHAFSDMDRSYLRFRNERMYFHQTLRVNYTTYDMRRDQDVINPRTHSDIMVHAHEDDTDSSDRHPYWYARVIAIFHAYVRYDGHTLTAKTQQSNEYQRMEFIWLRWFGRDLESPGGFETRRLHLVGFVGQNDTAAFGFLDPKEIIRGVHLIPAGAYGRTKELLAPSQLARREEDKDEDWERYYVGIFADRDMFMRFLGGGVGHSGSTYGWVYSKVTTSTTLNQDNLFEPKLDRAELDALIAELEGSETAAPGQSEAPENLDVKDEDGNQSTDHKEDPNVEEELIEFGYGSSSDEGDARDLEGGGDGGCDGDDNVDDFDDADDADDELEGFGRL
ncbi:hypothetical protein EUX98_g9774 [Antrodiella citrinella]|uniref:Uncharacterized protein n=1 Tax=Antrodiella citrinella TaxID=2447956 RepID=A0A4S4LN96_9APHY|nr:hypothetical protein EUX98_g9774 [Antrodiella citrinella]